MKNLVLTISFLALAINCIGQLTPVAMYNITLEENLPKRKYFDFIPLTETKQVLYLNAEIVEDKLKFNVLIMDSLLNTVKQTSIDFSGDLHRVGAEIENGICYIFLINEETGIGSTYQFAIDDFGKSKRSSFELKHKKLERFFYNFLNGIWYVAYIQDKFAKIASIREGKVTTHELTKPFLNENYFYSQVLKHSTASELAFIFYSGPDESFIKHDNHAYGTGYKQKNGFYIVTFSDEGEMNPTHLEIPFIEEAPIKDIVLAKLETSEYLVVGSYAERENERKSGFFTGKIKSGNFSVSYKYRFTEINDYLKYCFYGERKSKKLSEGNYIEYSSLIFQPLIKTGETFTSTMEFYLPVSTSGADLRTYSHISAVTFNADGKMVLGNSFPMETSEYPINNYFSRRDDLHSFVEWSDTVYRIQYTVKNKFCIVVLANGENTFKELNFESYIVNNHNSVIFKWWYGNNVLVYDNALTRFQVMSKKKYTAKRFAWK